jgi:hypothetical protein
MAQGAATHRSGEMIRQTHRKAEGKTNSAFHVILSEAKNLGAS